MSNTAPSPDSRAFDDLLGQLVDELAMSPAVADPAPQLRRVPEPAPDPVRVADGARVFAPGPATRRRRDTTPIAVAAILAGSIAVLAIAALLILPSGARVPTAPAAVVMPVAPPVAAPPAVAVPVAVATSPVPTPVVTPPTPTDSLAAPTPPTRKKPAPKKAAKKTKRPPASPATTDFDAL